MRDDIDRLLVQRPRKYRGCRGRRAPGYPRASLQSRARDLDALPSKEGMGAGYAERSFDEYFAPLVRFLRKSVGRPWSKVRGEIAAHVRPTSTVQRHVLQHLEDFVAEHAFVKGGVVWAQSRSGLRPLAPNRGDRRFYVCPRTGLLRRAPLRPASFARSVVQVDERTLLVHLGSRWLRVDLAPLPPSLWSLPKAARPRDALCGAPVGSRAWRESPLRADPRLPRDRYAAAAREVGKEERGRLLTGASVSACPSGSRTDRRARSRRRSS